MKTINISKNEQVLVDDENYEYLNQWRWTFHPTGYAIRTIRSNGKYAHIRMHRLIAKTPKGMETDHINGNKLDNRKENLRICTKSENAINRSAQSNNKVHIKGVIHFPYCFQGEKRYFRRKQWLAKLKKDGKTIFQKYFLTKEEAALAYNESAKKYFGEFAKLNTFTV